MFFIAKNVSGIRSTGHGDLDIILDNFRDSGYTVTPHLYKAEEYGVPQTRHRVIIVGFRSDLGLTFKVPSPVPYKDKDISAGTALAGIPEGTANNEIRRLSDNVTRRLSYIRPGENIWQAEKKGILPEEFVIHTKTKISQIYRKLDPAKPAHTVTAAGGGGTAGYHWTNRELTNRERARLQTFPDNFVFTGNYASVRRQIGMAVPCRLANIVATAVLDCLANIEYPSVEQNL